MTTAAAGSDVRTTSKLSVYAMPMLAVALAFGVLCADAARTMGAPSGTEFAYWHGQTLGP